MFIGEYRHSIDDKGRLIIPARFREKLGEGFVLTKGLDKCLFGFALEEWAALEQRLRQLPFTKADARAFVRFFFSGATESELDRQGRIVVPAGLRGYAGLQKDVMVIGIASRVEIWDATAWEEYNKATEKNYGLLAENMDVMNLGV